MTPIGSDNTDQPSVSLAAVLRHVMIDSNPTLTPLDTPDPPTTHAERRVPGQAQRDHGQARGRVPGRAPRQRGRRQGGPRAAAGPRGNLGRRLQNPAADGQAVHAPLAGLHPGRIAVHDRQTLRQVQAQEGPTSIRLAIRTQTNRVRRHAQRLRRGTQRERLVGPYQGVRLRGRPGGITGRREAGGAGHGRGARGVGERSRRDARDSRRLELNRRVREPA